MIGYIQRHPCVPKATWWKNYVEDSNLDIEKREIKEINRNKFIRQFSFDCVIEQDEDVSRAQPIDNLATKNSKIIISTQHFANQKIKPKPGEIIQYRNLFWIIEQSWETDQFLPKTVKTLHITLKNLNCNKPN